MPKIPTFQQEVVGKPAPVAPQQSPERVASQEPIAGLGLIAGGLEKISGILAETAQRNRKISEHNELLRSANEYEVGLIDAVSKLGSEDPNTVVESFDRFTKESRDKILGRISNPVLRESMAIKLDSYATNYRLRVLSDARKRTADINMANISALKEIAMQDSVNSNSYDNLLSNFERFSSELDIAVRNGTMNQVDAEKERADFLKKSEEGMVARMIIDSPGRLSTMYRADKTIFSNIPKPRLGELMRLDSEQEKKSRDKAMDDLLFPRLMDDPVTLQDELKSGVYDDRLSPKEKHEWIKRTEGPVKDQVFKQSVLEIVGDKFRFGKSSNVLMTPNGKRVIGDKEVTDQSAVDMFDRDVIQKNSKDPQDMMSLRMQLIENTGIVPTDLSNNMKALFIGGSNDQKQQVLDFYVDLKRRSPAAVKDAFPSESSDSNSLVSQGEFYDRLLRAGLNPALALTHTIKAHEEVPKDVLTLRARRASHPDLINKNNIVLKESFEKEMDAPLLPLSLQDVDALPQQLKDDFYVLVRDFAMLSGDTESARASALVTIKDLNNGGWGASGVGGEWRIMRYAPESVFPINKGNATREYMSDFDDFVKQSGLGNSKAVSGRKLTIQSDMDTEMAVRSSMQTKDRSSISWAVGYIDEIGFFEPLLLKQEDKNGVPVLNQVRWSPRQRVSVKK